MFLLGFISLRALPRHYVVKMLACCVAISASMPARAETPSEGLRPALIVPAEKHWGLDAVMPATYFDQDDGTPPIFRDPNPNLLDEGENELGEHEFGYVFRESFAPSGHTGRSGILPRAGEASPHFETVEDRWRIGMQPWHRYPGELKEEGRRKLLGESPYAEGSIRDPYHQNVLKGDFPVWGQHTFLNLTATENLILEGRQVPTPNSPFEVTPDPDSSEFFGDPDQFFMVNNIVLSVDLIHGDGAFKPADWRVKISQIFNVNHLTADEFGVVSPDVGRGTARTRYDYALEEWFLETKIADTSPHYDFASVRAGSQFFSSDFRGFLFSDTNRGVRMFGTRNANRDQFNFMFLDLAEKGTNSFLNTFEDRGQNVFIANYFHQDFIWPGYTASLSYHFNEDQPDFHFDENGFLARPDPAGVFSPHDVQAHYLGWSGDGHINRLNLSHQYYMAIGRDSLNPIGGARQDIFAQMAAVELSVNHDWARFQTSYFWTSGDGNPLDQRATGFDVILDNPNFVGGQFSYWNRQQIKLLEVNLVNRLSLVPNLRSSKFEGQSNFVNPGIHIQSTGIDTFLTPRLKTVTTANFLWFDQTEVLEQFVFQSQVHNFIGADLSFGAEYRPLLNNNIILVGGVSTLIPGQGFRDLYDPITGNVNTLVGSFVDITLTY